MEFRFFGRKGPERGDKNEQIYQEELETRIAVAREEKADLIKFLTQSGASKVIPERIVATTRFELPKKAKLEKPYFDLPLDVVDDEDEKNFGNAISLLGFNISSGMGGYNSLYTISQAKEPKKLDGYLVRLRQQNSVNPKTRQSYRKITFTVKDPAEAVSEVLKSRLEVEAEIKKPVDLINFLKAAGIEEGDYRETKRTTFKTANGRILIELDEFPDLAVPLSVEFEGQNPDEILAEANRFQQFGKASAIGGTKFLKQYLPKEKIKDMRFDSSKRHFGALGRPYLN